MINKGRATQCVASGLKSPKYLSFPPGHRVPSVKQDISRSVGQHGSPFPALPGSYTWLLVGSEGQIACWEVRARSVGDPSLSPRNGTGRSQRGQGCARHYRVGQQGALPLWRSQSSGGRTTDIWNAMRTNTKDLHVRGQGFGRHSLGK